MTESPAHCKRSVLRSAMSPPRDTTLLRVSTAIMPIGIAWRNDVATTQMTKTDPKALEARRSYLAEQYGMTPSQIDVVRNAICIGASDEELEFFLATAKRVNLDPFARQIWFVKRRQKRVDDRGNDVWIDVGRPETGIDGYRTIAERSNEYEGQAPMLWCGDDGKWVDVWLKKDLPAAAKATIFRRGFREPLVNVAVFEEYAPRLPKTRDLPAMWAKMAANQIAKCAEAGAFRRAFPRDLSGLVTDVEMQHVDQQAATYSAPTSPAPTSKQIDTAIVDQAPATAKQAAPSGPVAKSATDEWTPDERECSVLMDRLIAAEKRSEIADIGNMISAAKKKEPDAERTKMLLETVWPAFQSTWKALPEDRK